MIPRANQNMILAISTILAALLITMGCAENKTDGIVHLHQGNDMPYLFPINKELKERYNFPARVDEINRFVKRVCRDVNPENPRIAEIAAKISGGWDKNQSDIEKIMVIYEYVKSRWIYDRNSENFEQSLSLDEVLREGFHGNSYEYSVLMSSILEACGFKARIVLGCSEVRDLCMAFPEVSVGTGNYGKNAVGGMSSKMEKKVYYSYDQESDEYWVSLDVIEGLGGKPPIDRIYLMVYPENGEWKAVTDSSS